MIKDVLCWWSGRGPTAVEVLPCSISAFWLYLGYFSARSRLFLGEISAISCSVSALATRMASASSRSRRAIPSRWRFQLRFVLKVTAMGEREVERRGDGARRGVRGTV